MPPSLDTQMFMELIAISVIVQAWLAGLFIGKITKGAYSGGFFYSIMFVAITIVSLLIVQLHIVNIGAILKTPAQLS